MSNAVAKKKLDESTRQLFYAQSLCQTLGAYAEARLNEDQNEDGLVVRNTAQTIAQMLDDVLKKLCDITLDDAVNRVRKKAEAKA